MLQYRIIPVTPLQQNCTLVWCDQTGEAALIDAGGDIDRILALVRQQQLQPGKLWVTHGHVDHVGAVAALKSMGWGPVEGPHQADAYWLDLVPAAAARFGLPQAEAFVPDRWLDHGDVLRLGYEQFQVLHCPGHTPGHVVLYHHEQQLAWVGDVLFAGSIGRSDFPGGDGPELIRSIRTRLFALGNQVQFVPGHGPMSTFGAERQTNPYVADRLFTERLS